VLKDIFVKLNFFQKVEVYFLVIFFYGLIYYYIPDNIIKKDIDKSISKNEVIFKDIKILKSKITIKNNLILLKLLIDKSNNYNIFIVSSKNQKNKISLNIKGKFIDTINYINFIKTHFILDSLSFKYDKDILYSDITLDTKYFYNSDKKIYKLENIVNPFVNIKRYKNKIVDTSDNKKLKLNAIIDTNVLINQKWYKLYDKIKNYKIIKIGQNKVELKDLKTNKILILRVNHESK